MKLFSILRDFIFPIIANQRTQLAGQQQAFEQLTKENKIFRNELQYIYTILIHRSGCRLRLYPLLRQETLLFAIEKTSNQLNFYLYIPNKQSSEIGLAYAYIRDKVLVLYELHVDAPFQDPNIRNLLLQQVTIEAKIIGLAVENDLENPLIDHTCPINLNTPLMRLLLILCLVSAFAFQACCAQPARWFVGFGGGITRLTPALYNGKKLSHNGDMVTGLTGVDIPFHRSFRPVVRATLSFSNAYFHCTQIPAYDRGSMESYDIHLSSITTELSFLYHVINRKLKLYGGAGANYHYSWSNHNSYNEQYTSTWAIFNNRNNLALDGEWVSFNAKAGLKLGRCELGLIGDINGIISVSNFQTLHADLYYLWFGFQLNKAK